MRRLVRAAPSSSSARKMAKSADLKKKKNKQSKKRAPQIVSLDHYSSQVLELILSVEDLLLVDQHLDQLDDADFIFSIDELVVELVVDDQTPSFHPDAAEESTSILMAFDDDQQLDVSDDDDPEMIFSVDELLVAVDPMAEEKPSALMAFGDDTDYVWIDVLEEDQEIINIFMACFDDDDDQLQYNNDPTA